MDTLLPFALLCFTSFFTLTNPLGTMPVFLTMTNGMSDDERKTIVRRATIVSFITLMVFTFSGQFLFKFSVFLRTAFVLPVVLLSLPSVSTCCRHVTPRQNSRTMR